ncbi:hypothetical protein ACQY0O_002501 [Thecaphora frezii]
MTRTAPIWLPHLASRQAAEPPPNAVNSAVDGTSNSTTTSTANNSNSTDTGNSTLSHAAQNSTASSSSKLFANDTRVVLRRGYSNGQLTYDVPVVLAGQQLNLQLDTNSADMWVANTDCNTDSCKGREGKTVVKFDDNADAVVDQDTPFSISYLQGSASGHIKTASVLLGDPAVSRLAVNSQAFASVDSVSSEDLDTGNFSGVLGLGLPSLSTIQASLNDTSNTAATNDGVTPPNTGAVLSGLWRNLRQGRRFVGLGLQRLEEDGGTGNSVLTVGSHDPTYSGTDLSKISYAPVVPDADGVSRHWRLYLTQIAVLLKEQMDNIPIGSSTVLGSGYPVAVFDTSASVNLGPRNVLNALYGAWNIGPASDGGYYVPCDLQMNIILTLGGVSVPIHPLDASLYSSTGVGTAQSNSACIGSFQALRSLSGGGSSTDASGVSADFILSPAFLRSVYTVLSCDDPIVINANNASSQLPTDPAGPCKPQIGLRPLVNMTQATDQFTQVRVRKQSLGNSGLTGSEFDDGTTSKGLSGGIKVVIGCIAAIVAIAAIFGVALWRLRKRRRLIAAQRAAMLAAAPEKGALSRQGGGGGSRSGRKSDGLLMPMAILVKDDEEEASNNVLSPAQRAKARQLQQMHGVFDDELAAEYDDDPERAAAGLAPRWGDDPHGRNSGLQPGTTTWDVSSTGYIDARKVKNEYLSRLNDDERQLFLARNSDHNSDSAGAGKARAVDADGHGDSMHTSDRSSDQAHGSSDSHGNARPDSPSPLLGPRV